MRPPPRGQLSRAPERCRRSSSRKWYVVPVTWLTSEHGPFAWCPVQDAAVDAHRQHIMDKRGEGVPIILDESERLTGRRPAYRLVDESEVQLIIFAANPEPEDGEGGWSAS